MRKREITLKEVLKEIKKIKFPHGELVVGIAYGGVVPASLVAYNLKRDLRIIRLNYRDEDNIPQRPEPALLETIDLPRNVTNILLVDDVSVSGKTLRLAKKLLNGYRVITFVLKGKADYVLFPKLTTCVKWPWKA